MHGRWKFDQKLKNRLDFIWKDFDSRSWRNKSHSILICISWDSIKNKFSQSTMEKLVPWGLMKEKLEVWWKNDFLSWNGVRSLSFHAHTSMRWKFLETRTKSSQLSKISHKLSLLVSPLVLQIQNAQMRHKRSKMRVYIRDIGEGKLKSHQINGSLSLGNIIVHLP
jgi:hypothetical protein